MKERFPWGRILAEALAIVASILLALAIDAWWDSRQARRAESAFLVDIHAEFTQNRTRLEAVIEGQRRRVELYRVVMREAGPGAEGLSSDSLKAIVRSAYLNPGFYPRTDALERGTAGAGLDLIQDPGLRRGISGFWDSYGHYFRNQARYADVLSEPEVLFETGTLVLRDYPEVPGMGETEMWSDSLSQDQANALKFYAYAQFLAELVASQGAEMLVDVDSLVAEIEAHQAR